MNCYTEKDFDDVIVRSEPLTDIMYHHLLECDACRELFLFLSGWHECYLSGRTSGRALSDEHERILQPLDAGGAQSCKAYRLAAQGEQPTALYLVRSFSSPEHGLVGRLMQNHSNHQLFLYLIADQPQEVQAVRVELEGTGLEGITDLQGRIDFGIQPTLNCTAMRIHAPQAVFELAEHLAPLPAISHQHTFVIKNEHHDELVIELAQGESHCTYHLHFKHSQDSLAKNLLEVVAITDRRTIRGELHQGISIIETEKPERLLRVQIY